MRILISALALLFFLLFGCNETIDDDTAKKPEIKVSEILAKINDSAKQFPINDIALISVSKEAELFAGLENMVFDENDLISIAIIRKNQGRYESALRWLSMKTLNSELYIEIRFIKAEILFLLGKFKESYILCNIEVLPDEVSPAYQQKFKELMKRIEKEMSKIDESRNSNIIE